MSQYRWSFSIGVSLIVNLLIFLTLAVFLAIRVQPPEPLKPLKLIEIEQSIGSLSAPKVNKASGTPAVRHQDAKPAQVQEEPSVLSQIEAKVLSQLKEGSLGESKAGSLSQGGFGLDVGERKLIYAPPLPKLYSDEPLSSVTIKIYVEPSGIVSKAQIIQRSGSAEVDRALINFCMSLKFAPVNGKYPNGDSQL
ncbi:MAG: energy transducer TonB [Aquificaceae bacterium]|nr:energy transducer TonB [Aquificaceae bacterium]